MRAALGMGGYLAATWATAVMVLGKWIPRPQGSAPAGPLGLIQAFAHCPDCRRNTAHIIHDTTCRTCQDCGHRTNPGDPT